MKRLLAGAIFILCSTVIAMAGSVGVPGTNVSFDPPAGFELLSDEVMDIKYNKGQRPETAYGNSTAATSIAFDLRDIPILSSQLDGLREVFVRDLGRIIPGVQWIRHETVEMSGHRWVYLEMTSSAIDTDIHNIMLLTSYRGKLLLFNFNSTREEFPRYEQQLRQSIASISVRP